MFTSSFDGLPEFMVPTNVLSVTQTIETLLSVSTLLAGAGVGGGGDDYLKDLLLYKAKLSNKITEDLVKKYHASFLSLYRHAQHQIKLLEREVNYFKNPVRDIIPTIKIIPQDAEIKPEMIQYIIEANALGVSLLEVLPPELIPQ